MDDLTNHVLILLGQGKISKEAALAALVLNPDGVIKLSAGPGEGSSNSSFMTTAKQKGLEFLLNKAFGGVESGVDKLLGKVMTGGKDAVFQKMMRQHPQLTGKDPSRAKANFDYIVATSPHLLKHPMILGDTVANMTAMGMTALPTLNELAELQKNVTQKTEKKPSDFVSSTSKDLSRSLFKDPAAPVPTTEQQAATDVDALLEHAKKKQMVADLLKTKIPDPSTADRMLGGDAGASSYEAETPKPTLKDLANMDATKHVDRYLKNKMVGSLVDIKANEKGLNPDEIY
jgi:hypothetical protein